MLEEMRIRGLGVITDAVLELDPGLTVVTGETGAGKTMVVTGLGLLLGGRADAGAVRTGVEQAVVEGRVTVEPQGAVARAAAQAGAELDDDVLLLARSVSAGGRSRAYAGGRSVPAAVLGELASELVTVHGQSDQLRLLQPGRQRQTLDRFAGTGELLAELAQRHGRLREVERELADVLDNAAQRAESADRIRGALEAVEHLDPQPGEQRALVAEDERLANADALRAAATAAHQALARDDVVAAAPGGDGADARTLIGLARRALDPVREHDPALAGLEQRLAEVGYLLDDVAGDLAGYGAGIESDPARLSAVQQRRADLTDLARRVRLLGGAGELAATGAETADEADEVLAWAELGSRRLLDLDDDQGRVGQLRAERDALVEAIGGLAGRLHAARAAAGARLSELVAAELAQLAMPQAQLQVALTQRADDAGIEVALPSGPQRVAVHAHGADDVELLLAPHPGAPLRPVAKGASGGELSRVMLAIEVVLAGSDPVPTFVFDEVDAGVGGRAAVEIGRRLAALARTAQVVVVTHLPQVAAFADRHLMVVKSDDGAVTESGVRRLDGEDRVGELARMLAGQQDSDTARAHARELLDAARGVRESR